MSLSGLRRPAEICDLDHNRFEFGHKAAVASFAEADHIPVVRFGKDDRKIDRMRPYLARQAATGRSGVAAIGTAQEFQNVFAASQRTGDGIGQP